MDYREKIEERRKNLVDTLVKFIETNPEQWEAGWYKAPSLPAMNAKTQKNYQGLNAFYLHVIGVMRGYRDPRWLTFQQAKDLGAHVNSGEKSSDVFYWSWYDKQTKKPFDEKTLEGMDKDERKAYMEENVRPVLKYYQVFNAEQCSGLPAYEPIQTPEMEAQEQAKQNALIERVIENSEAPVTHDGGNRAYYSLTTDSIHLPKISDFKTMQDYYATALHEIAHSTGHQSRLNRKMVGSFGTEDYAKEELRAELASVFMQSELGISVDGRHFENHGAYLASWLKAVKNNPKEFYSAASDAEKISDYVAEHYVAERVQETEKTVLVAAARIEAAAMERTPQSDFERALGEVAANLVQTPAWMTSDVELTESEQAAFREIDKNIEIAKLLCYEQRENKDAREARDEVAAQINLKAINNYLQGKEIGELPKAVRDEYETWKMMSVDSSMITVVDETYRELTAASNEHKKKQAAEQPKETVIPEKSEKPLIINFYAGPGAGKTTAALELTAALKKAGVNVEYVSEYAKELVLEKRLDLIGNQQHVTDEQYHRLDRLREAVDVVVTDSPVLLGIVYGGNRIDDAYRGKIRSYYDSFNNIDLRIERRTTYQSEGRLQTEEEAKALDAEITKMLDAQGVEYSSFEHGQFAGIIERVKNTQEKQVAQDELAEQEKQVKQVKQVERDSRGNITLTIPNEQVGNEYGNSRMIRLPKGEYHSLVFFAPKKAVKQVNEDGSIQLSVNEKYKYVLKNDGLQVELNGKELCAAFEGQVVGKSAQRVAKGRFFDKLQRLQKNVPDEMKAMPNWCAFKTAPKSGSTTRRNKIVLSAVTGEWAKVNDPNTWTDFDTAMKFAENNQCEGLTFVLPENSSIACIDLDSCYDASGKMSPLAEKLTNELAGKTYTEKSVSGVGIHIFMKDNVLNNGEYKNIAQSADGEIEVWGKGHMISMTGDIMSEQRMLGKCPMETMQYLRKMLGKRTLEKKQAASSFISSDENVIERIRRSKKKNDFDTLFNGGDITGDRNRDDMRLLNILAYFTDCNESQMESIFRSSARYREPGRESGKGGNYLSHSISKACATLTSRMSFGGFGGGKKSYGAGK